MDKNPSKLRYTSGGLDNGDTVGTANNESEIYFENLTIGGFPENSTVIAQEITNAVSSASCTATVSDIQINTKYRLSRAPTGTNKIQYKFIPNTSGQGGKKELFEYGGSSENLTSTVMHELGHTAGLEHEGDKVNLMGGDNLVVVNGNAIRPYIGEDSAGGLLAIYGARAETNEDVSVSHGGTADKMLMAGATITASTIAPAYSMVEVLNCLWFAPTANRIRRDRPLALARNLFTKWAKAKRCKLNSLTKMRARPRRSRQPSITICLQPPTSPLMTGC